MASGGQWLGIGWAPWRGGGISNNNQTECHTGGIPPPFQCVPGAGTPTGACCADGVLEQVLKTTLSGLSGAAPDWQDDSPLALLKALFRMPDLEEVNFGGRVVTPDTLFHVCQAVQRHGGVTAVRFDASPAAAVDAELWQSPVVLKTLLDMLHGGRVRELVAPQLPGKAYHQVCCVCVCVRARASVCVCATTTQQWWFVWFLRKGVRVFI